MSRQDKDLISSNGIAKFIFALIKIITFPIRKPILTVFTVGLLIVMPVVGGGVSSYNDLLGWYVEKLEPVTRRVVEFSTAFSKHTGLQDAATTIKKNVALETKRLKSQDLVEDGNELIEVSENNSGQQLETVKKVEPEMVKNTGLNAGSIYGTSPVVVAKVDKKPETNSSGDEFTDLEQPQEIIFGKAEAMGGDRLMIDNKIIRLDGIRVAKGDSDISAQRFLRNIISGKDIECLVFEYTANDVPLGWCFVDDEEINSMLVDKGFALSY